MSLGGQDEGVPCVAAGFGECPEFFPRVRERGWGLVEGLFDENDFWMIGFGRIVEGVRVDPAGDAVEVDGEIDRGALALGEGGI